MASKVVGVLLATLLSCGASAQPADEPQAATPNVEAEVNEAADIESALGPAASPPPTQTSDPAEAAGPVLQAPSRTAGPGVAALNALPSGSRVAIIPIEGMIYDFTLESLQRRVDRALAAGATVIVVELDTPGGVVTSAIDICKYLKTLGVPTVAWINDQAYSAGTMIASACDFIVMSPSSTFGDSAPVTPAGDMAPTERLKALSPVLAEYKDNATANGYDYAAFHAMCVVGIELYYVENVATGERRIVNQTDFDILVNDVPFDEAMATHVRADAGDDEVLQIARPTPTFGATESGAWRAVETLPSGTTLPNGLIHDGTTLYTLSQSEAIDLGLAVKIVANDADLKSMLGAASITAVQQTWSESLAGFLTNPFVRGVLVLCVLVGAYVEFQSPGLGFPGGVAAIALVVLLGAPFVVGLAEVWHLLLMLIGIVLLAVELIATPTFGLLGIAGIVMILSGLALSIVPTGNSGPLPLPAPGTGPLLLRSSVSTLAAFVIAGVAMAVLTRFYGSIPILNRLILTNEPANPPGVSAPRDAIAGDHVFGGAGVVAVGVTGLVTESGLRPSGRVEINGQLVDAVSTGDFLDPGTAVRVTEVSGNRVVVDTVENA